MSQGNGQHQNGSTLWPPVKPSHPCPKCGKGDWCAVSPDGVWCRCYRLPGGQEKDDGNGQTFYLYRLLEPEAGSVWPVPRFNLADGKGERADPETLHKVYSALLGNLPLYKTHADDLERRGVNRHAVKESGYRSLGKERSAAVRSLIESGLESLFPRVPGFFVKEKNGKPYWAIGGWSGLLIPVRGVSEQIVALMIRADAGQSGPKYRYLSSKKKGGAGPGAPVHVPFFAGDRTTARLTEGALKADVATALSSILTIGTPGLASRQVVKVLQELGAKIIRIAYDADWRTNPNVANAIVKLAAQLQREGFVLEIETWPIEAGKGIDDVLASGGTATLIKGEAVAPAIAEIQEAARPAISTDAANPSDKGPTKDEFTNYYETSNDADVKIKVGYPLRTIYGALQHITGGWPKYANGLLFAERADHEPQWMKSPAELFAWIGGQLNENATTNGLKWAQGPDKVPQTQLYAFITQSAPQFDAVESYPHHPPMPRHCYMHPSLAKTNTGAFLELLRRFQPSTTVDADLIIAAWMTPFAGIEGGQRPAFLIQAEDDDKHRGRGAGKTTFAELIGRLCGGHVEMRANDDWDKLVTRLLSPQALTKRVAILDNVKTLRFSWADFEAGITAAVISGRQLYVGEGRRPNTLSYFITLNGANLSKDMAQRCVPIVLKRPEYKAAWEEETIRLIETRRWEIISDILRLLAAPAEPLKRFSRWSTWEQAVLSRVDEPAECQVTIAERQAAIDDDQTEADIVRDGFRAELVRRGHNPDKDVVWMASEEAAKIINTIENEEKRRYNHAIKHLYMLGIKEIRKSNRGDYGRGCTWTGEQSPPNHAAEKLRSY